MNKIKYIVGMLIMLYVMQACYDDNSSLADQPIIEVGINSGTRDSIDIYFNDTLKINPDWRLVVRRN